MPGFQTGSEGGRQQQRYVSLKLVQYLDILEQPTDPSSGTQRNDLYAR
jgi:hypothetical protein